MHLKRQSVKKFWPVPRKGTKYIAVANHEKAEGIPLTIVMRDILGLVKTKKELQGLINEKKILINGKIIIDVKRPVLLYDSISLPLVKKYFRAILKGKKIGFNEISEKGAQTKIYKIIGKKILKGKKAQFNLNNGRNILSSEKMDVGNFIVLDIINNKITKIISLQKGAEVVVVKGKHVGINGKIDDIKEEGSEEIVEITTSEGEEIKVNLNDIFAKQND